MIRSIAALIEQNDIAASFKIRELVAGELNIPKLTLWCIIRHNGQTGNILKKK